MPTEVFFTVVILVRQNPHLLHLTLESLAAQEEKRFEVMLIGKLKEGRLDKLLAGFLMPIRLIEAGEGTQGELMNRAAAHSRGRYLQFLYPGDRYISQQTFSYLEELIEVSGVPELVYCAFLQRDLSRPPEALSFPLNLSILKKGEFPTMIRSSWILKTKLFEMGGFDARLDYRPLFDFLCRLFLKPDVKAIYTRRVFVDYELKKKCPRETMGYVSETLSVLYRRFGLKPTFSWALFQDRTRLFKWAVESAKRIFWKEA